VNRRPILFALLALALATLCRASEGAEPLLDLSQTENRIVFIGDGFIEQARLNGHIETRLLRSFPPDHNVTFHNLGWSGDSVSGAARTAGYENPAGLDRLVKEVTALKPTAIFIGYGMVESFQGEKGLTRFSDDYKHLLATLSPITPKLILLSPIFHENLGPPLKDPSDHNRSLAQYTAVIAAIAEQQKLPFVDLFQGLSNYKRAHPAERLTSNGITLTDAGYSVVAAEIERQLGLDGKQLTTDLTVENLRQEIIRRNELFYRRSRPFNDHSRHWTYISGDYALYDRQLADVDQAIAELRRRAAHESSITRKKASTQP
jgi:lysophospholipase L1-like esterase